MVARALIVDDESPAREELRHQLAGFDDVEVVGEATTAEEAQVLIESVGYDLVFLDIRMPGVGGVELAHRLALTENRPAIIFTTAFVDHAVEAFELGATDYLVKPFDAARLRRAIDRAIAEGVPQRESGEGSLGRTIADAGVSPPIEALASGDLQREVRTPVGDDREPPQIGRDRAVRIPVHRGDRILLIDEPRIAFAEAARGYAYLTLVALPAHHPLAGAERLLSSHSLVDLEERFSDAFVRTHRSYLVNLRLVREVMRQVGGGVSLVMGDRNRSLVPVARRQAAEVRRRLGV